MAYTKHNWLKRLGTGLNKFKDTISGQIFAFVNQPDDITQQGTPIREDWLNEMEDGIADAHNTIDDIIDGTQAAGNASKLQGNSANVNATGWSIAQRGGDGNLKTNNRLWFSDDDGLHYNDDTNQFLYVVDGVAYEAFHSGNFPMRHAWDGTRAREYVVGQLAWSHYGNNHTIFDASHGITPSGTACDMNNAQNPWSPSIHRATLMCWNGSQTYGVRVDSARNADMLGNTQASDYATIKTYTITIPTTGWVDSGDAEFPKVLWISNPSVKDTSIVDLNVHRGASYTIAQDAGLAPFTESYNGTFAIFAMSIPTGNITATIKVVG